MEGEGGGRGKWEEMEGACGERRDRLFICFRLLSTALNAF